MLCLWAAAADVAVWQASEVHDYAVRLIYYVGFSASIISLIIALFLFIYFRSDIKTMRANPQHNRRLYYLLRRHNRIL